MPKEQETLAEGLQVRGIVKSFAKRAIVRGVNLNVTRGKVTALLGPNGAGKTTCFYMVVGLVKPDAGVILMDGADITRMPMYQRARMGISYLAQEASIFRGMTVEQNVMSVVEMRQRDRRKAQQTVTDLLDELNITHLRKSAAPGLSGGERRRVEIARALASEPSFLLMDEPFAGLDPLAVADISKVVDQLKHRDLGILITDHNVRETLDIVDRASIIYDGRVLFDGAPEEMLTNAEVRRVYLGKTFDEPADEAADAAASEAAVAGLAPNLHLEVAEPRHEPRSPWKEFWELTNKPKNSPLVFGGGIFCGVVFGLFVGTVMLHPNQPAAPTTAVAQQRAVFAHGQAYADAFKLVSDDSLWTRYGISWRLSKPPYTIVGQAPHTFATPTVQYDYAAVSTPFDRAAIREEMILRVDVSDVQGKVGLSLVNPDGSPLVSEEQIVTGEDGQRSLFFRIRPSDLPAEFLIRNGGDASGDAGSVTIKQAWYTPISRLSPAQMNAVRKIGLNKPVKP